MLLVTLPSEKVAAENQVVSLADNQQIQWKTVYINGTHEQNLAKINALTTADKYVKIVMQVDWRPTAYVRLQTGGYVIWDLNGHGLHFNGACDLSVRGEIGLELLEITDSSAAGNGYIYNTADSYGTIDGNPRQGIIISGGHLRACIGDAKQVIMTGGKITTGYKNHNIFYNNADCKTHFAPWIDTSNPQDYHAVSNTTNAVLAVSPSDQYCGAYNYAYSAGWTLGPGDCVLEKMTQPGAQHYFWLRNGNDAWYHLWTAL